MAIGDRRGRFPWGLATLGIVLAGLALWGIYWGLSGLDFLP